MIETATKAAGSSIDFGTVSSWVAIAVSILLALLGIWRTGRLAARVERDTDTRNRRLVILDRVPDGYRVRNFRPIPITNLELYLDHQEDRQGALRQSTIDPTGGDYTFHVPGSTARHVELVFDADGKPWRLILGEASQPMRERKQS